MSSVVTSFPGYVRVWAHPGLASYISTEEEIQSVFGIGTKDPYDPNNTKLIERVKWLMANRAFWDLSGKACEKTPYILDVVRYQKTLTHVEKTLRNPLDTYEKFAAYLKAIHILLADPRQKSPDGTSNTIIIGEFRSCKKTMVDITDSTKSDPESFYVFCNQENPHLTSLEKADLKKLMDLICKPVDSVDFVDLEDVETKKLVSAKATNLFRKFIKVYPSSKRIDALMRAAFAHFTVLCKAGDTIKAASFLHVEIVGIHPFADANGRVARVMLNRTLMLGGHQPIAFQSKAPYVEAVKAEQAGKVGAFERFVRPIVAEYEYEALPNEHLIALASARQFRALWDNGWRDIYNKIQKDNAPKVS